MVTDLWYVYISNLVGVANEEMLEETFGQIGLVLEAGVEREGCGWVKFQKVEDALEAVERFDGVVFAKQAMYKRWYVRAQSLCGRLKRIISAAK